MLGDKTYLLDTNVFRYYVSRKNDEHRRVQPFWEEVKFNDEYSLLVCDETKRELEVQAVNSNLTREVEQITHELFPLVEEVKYKPDLRKEHLLRLFAAHVKYKGYDVKVPTGIGSEDPDGFLKMIYPAISDARIILTAIANTSGIVTTNLKDFAVLSAFGYDVWDPTTNRHVEIDEAVIHEMEQDTQLINLSEQILDGLTL